jgi:hypothetical protein
MDDPLSGWIGLARIPQTIGCAQFADDVLSGAVNVQDCAAFQAFGLARWWGFKGFAMAAKDGFNDAVAADAGVHSASNGLYLWQLRH